MKQRNTDNRLHINLGFVCNNNCIFCMEEDRERRFAALRSQTTDEIMAMLEAHRGSGEVMFTSGEPTLHEGLPDFIAAARRLNYHTIGLITNARRLGYASYAMKLVRAGLNHVVISIHGHTDDLHTRLSRTRGAYEQTVKGIRTIAVLKRRFTIKLHTSTVVNKRNYLFFKEIYLFLKGLGVDQTVFNYIQAQGRGADYFDALFPRYTDVSHAFKMFLSHTPANNDCYLLDIPYCVTEDLPGFSRGFVERHMHYEVVAPGGGDSASKYELIDRDMLDDIYKSKRPECRSCRYFTACTGVWKVYIQKFGWDEFEPVIIHAGLDNGCAANDCATNGYADGDDSR